jgi:CheY-like chemotaxis protein
MAPKNWKDKPLALIVEDNEGVLKGHLVLLEQMGFHSIGVTNWQDALKEFRATPAIDIVITDINLGDPDPERDGVFLAKEIRRLRTRLPVVGYSAAFEEGELGRSDCASFDSYVAKGKSGPKEIIPAIRHWREIALQSRRARITLIKAELRRLQTKYEIIDRDMEYLLDFLPGGDLNSADGGAEEWTPADLLLAKAGYSLGLFEPDEFSTANDKLPSLPARALPYWRRRDDGLCIVELPGFSSIYAAGEDEETAVQALLQLVHSVWTDLDEAPASTLSTELDHLREFLARLYKDRPRDVKGVSS